MNSSATEQLQHIPEDVIRTVTIRVRKNLALHMLVMEEQLLLLQLLQLLTSTPD